MKTRVRYKRPWFGENADKLVVEVSTQQHGTARVVVCKDELTRIYKLFNDNFKYDHGRRADWGAMRKATAQAFAEFIATFLPDEIKPR